MIHAAMGLYALFVIKLNQFREQTSGSSQLENSNEPFMCYTSPVVNVGTRYGNTHGYNVLELPQFPLQNMECDGDKCTPSAKEKESNSNDKGNGKNELQFFFFVILC